VLDICAFVISTVAPVSSVEDRNGGEVEKSIKKQTCPKPSRGISRLAPLLSCESKKGGSLEMTRISALIIHNQYYKTQSNYNAT